MTKEEKKAYKQRRKELMKFGTAAKVLYLLFILALLGGSAYFLKLTWNECAAYQQASAATRVSQAIEHVEEVTGLEVKTNMIPVQSEENQMIYRLYSDGKGIADVTINKTRNCGIVLSIYDEPKIKGLRSFDILVPVNSSASVYEGETILDAAEHVTDCESGEHRYFTVPGKTTVNNLGMGVPEFKWIRVSDIYDISQVSISIDDRQLKVYPMEKNFYFAGDIADPDFNEVLRRYAAHLADLYSFYISSDLSYNELSSVICYNAPLRSRLLDVTLTWYGAHNGTEVKEMKVSDGLRLSDSLYLLNLDYIYLSHGIYSGDVEDRIRLCILLHLDSDGAWRIAELINHIEPNWMVPYELER